MINGEPPMFQMNFDEYLEHKKRELCEGKNASMSKEAAEDYIN
jgi:hypothetical protein